MDTPSRTAVGGKTTPVFAIRDFTGKQVMKSSVFAQPCRLDSDEQDMPRLVVSSQSISYLFFDLVYSGHGYL